MRNRHAFLPCLVLAAAAACGTVDKPGQDSAPSDHRDDGGGSVVVDAGGPDATPVACDGPEDCANPDDPCLLPGTSDGNVCSFPEKDCSELDGECTRGVCADDGECEARAIRQDMACGDGIMDCGNFGACGGFTEPCGESGTQTRSCTDSTCQAGECVRGAPYDDSRGCSRDTDGNMCADTETTCGLCSFGDCSMDGSRSCTRTEFTCSSGSCGSSMESFSDPCTRPQPECCSNGRACSGSTCTANLCQ